MPPQKNSTHHPQFDSWVPTSRRGLPPSQRTRKIIEKDFQDTHLRLFGTPSGTATFHITLSEDPRYWSYQAIQTKRLHQKPQTASQAKNPDYSQPFQNQIFLTDITVTACISRYWNQPPIHDFSIIGGALPLGCITGDTPPPPADTAWRVACALPPLAGKAYGGTFTVLYLLSLGSHYGYSPLFDEAPLCLIENIKATASHRLHGKPMSPTDWAQQFYNTPLGIPAT